LLGRYRELFQPLNVRAGRSRVRDVRGFGQYLYEPGFGYSFRTDSRLVSLDVSDPNEIVPLGETELPGTIQDSRRKGDVLYVVTHEDGYCYGCGSTPSTTVTSFDISDWTELRQIDQPASRSRPAPTAAPAQRVLDNGTHVRGRIDLEPEQR
jgi:hypothetical protein